MFHCFYHVLYVLVFVSCFGVISNQLCLPAWLIHSFPYLSPPRPPSCCSPSRLSVDSFVDYCFFIFLCLSSGCICVFVCVLNCLFCCHYGVIKHNNKILLAGNCSNGRVLTLWLRVLAHKSWCKWSNILYDFLIFSWLGHKWPSTSMYWMGR